MERTCVSCRHFADAHYSKVYITPTCTQRGTDSAAYMRQYVCGLDGHLYEPKPIEHDGKINRHAMG